MPENIRFNAVDPTTKRQVWKTFSTAKYSKEEIQKLGEEWRKEVLAGNLPAKSLPETIVKPQTPEIPFKPLESIELPDDKFGTSHLLLGMTRSGKSTLMNHLYDTHFRGYITLLHTGSHQSEIYKPLQRTCAVAPLFCGKLITETSKINSATKNHYKFLHIIDDVVDKKNAKPLLKLLTIGRNHRLSTIITGQELSIFNAIGRSNINYVYLFKLGSDMAIEKVIKSYLRSAFPSTMRMNEMIHEYKKYTDNHGFFVIDNLTNDVFYSRLQV